MPGISCRENEIPNKQLNNRKQTDMLQHVAYNEYYYLKIWQKTLAASEKKPTVLKFMHHPTPTV